MIKIGCNFFSILIGFLFLLFLLKIWIFLFPVILFFIFYSYRFIILNKIKSIFFAEKEFTAKAGIVYKECCFCGKKTDRKSVICSGCGKAFE